MNKAKIIILTLMIGVGVGLFLMPVKPGYGWLQIILLGLWIVLCTIIAINSDLFERPTLYPEKVADKYPEMFTIDPPLKEFLIKKGAYEEFCYEIYRVVKRWKKERIDQTINSVNTIFIWLDTPRGGKYWSDLENEYKELRNKS